MSGLVCYKRMPIWQKNTIPEMFTQRHNTKEGTYACLEILEGELEFVIFEGEQEETEYFNVQKQPPIIQPQVWHKIKWVSDDIKCQLSFLCEPQYLFYKQNNLSLPHSEIRYLVDILSPCKTLDLGSGRGRNTFYLAEKGYDVMAMDISQQHIDAINFIKEKEQLKNIRASVYDINLHNIKEKYDLIISTVVLMFLQREKIADIILNMQEQTNESGVNLIVCPIKTDSAPYSLLPFKCFLESGELKSYYSDWEIIKYNEDPGYLHKTDEHGNRIKLNFATLIARKQ
ncbi:SAM-dependent methyltransferase TehB [Photorhabdus heterorhabditis]|uniref:SAM-dependent methyltransferase TehB n=1 Tax=Photorhabdus heterorhabditis TaxID=880156 RepID=A0A5B0X6N5_9GAMM|nr:SAM-dependent methyltransferase TehB [Photorhabdus heterorhabditis]KAA1194923.1 SAM-dependent methyltransferase TehB [Photorhabdus heterorhabditis]MBS9442323.1 SAM-dependent methyltransferase TehB [Photorhabdus heterorhabditis]